MATFTPARGAASLGAVLTGLLAGGMVLIDVVLVPFWRSVSPTEFRQWFTAHSDRIRRVMAPLGAGAALLTVASAATQPVHDGRRSAASVTAAAAAVGVVAVTVTVNEPANHRFTGATLTDAETTELLRRWARWHHVRVGLGVLAAVAATVAAAQRGPDQGRPRRLR